ncbi:MAG: hypothetical protein ACI4D4_01405 [Lachnospira sp.]
MKKYLKIPLALVALIAGCAIFLIRVKYVNDKYPKVTKQEYSIGESFEWQDFKVKVAGYEILSADEVKDRWNGISTIYPEDCNIIIASMEVTYIGDEESKKYPLTSICGQSGAWGNASEMLCLQEFNKGRNVVKKGDTVTLYTSIEIFDEQFAKKDRNNYTERSMELVFQTYPEIISVRLY